MKKDEFNDLFDLLFLGKPQPSEALRYQFWICFNKEDVNIFSQAVAASLKEGFYGNPQVSDIEKQLREFRIKTIPESLDGDLWARAYEDAQNRVRPIDPKRQFKDPAALEEALYWNNKRLDDEAQNIYNDLKTKIETSVKKGIPVSQAVSLLLDNKPPSKEESKQILNNLLPGFLEKVK